MPTDTVFQNWINGIDLTTGSAESTSVLTLDAANTKPKGLWSDGTTLWVADPTADKVFAYVLPGLSRDDTKDITLVSQNGDARGLWSDGTTLWVADHVKDKVFAYTLVGGARDSGKELGLSGLIEPTALWSDGTHMWVSTTNGREVYAYLLSDGSYTSAYNFTMTRSNDEGNAGMWSDGTTVWVVDEQDTRAYAYSLTSGNHKSDAYRIFDPANAAPGWAWVEGSTTWVTDLRDGKVYVYSDSTVEPPTETTLVSNTGQTVNTSGSSHFQAQSFETGANTGGYTITEVQISLRTVTSGNTTLVKIREDDSGEPGTLVATLMNPATLTASALNTFTAPANTTLDASKTYWITVSEGISNRVTFASTDGDDETGETGWTIGNGRLWRSSESGNWVTATVSLVIAIKGTVDTATVSDTTVSISADRTSAVFKEDGITYTLTRTGSTTDALSVTVALTQTGDFLATSNLSRTETFGAGESTKTFSLLGFSFQNVPVGETVEGGTLTATVQAGTGYDLGTPASVDVTIVVALTVGFELSSYTIAEDGSSLAVKLVARTGAGAVTPDASATLSVSTEQLVPPEAESPLDYGAVSQTVTFAPSDFSADGSVFMAEKTISVPIVDDAFDELDERFNVVLELTPGVPPKYTNFVDTSGNSCGNRCNVTVTITDDDTVTMVPSNWSLVPTGLSTGDKFRLIFLSSTKRDGSSTDIATYNTFVQTRAAAGHTDIQAYSSGFTAVGCTAAVDAVDTTGTTGTGLEIYWLNGNKVADDYVDFYDEDWDEETADKNELGNNGPNTNNSGNYPLTGCDHDGTEGFGAGGSSLALGTTTVLVGRPNSTSTGHGPISSSNSTGNTNNRPMYGLSEVFQVVASTDATLSALTVNDGTTDLTLTPPFVPGIYVYEADVDNTVTTVTLSATVNDDTAEVSSVTLAGTAIADTVFSDGITVPSLVEGDNKIVVRVTAEDTSTTQPYTVTVMREVPPLTETEVPGGWSLEPSGLTIGDKFRLLVVTSGTRDATATDMATYNTFVQSDVSGNGHADIQSLSSNFRVLGCTSILNAIANTRTDISDTSAPIYWLNGDKVADDYADLYDETWGSHVPKLPNGTNAPTSGDTNQTFTGCVADGDTHGFHLGSMAQVTQGLPTSLYFEINGGGTSRTNSRKFYGLSGIFTVVASSDATLSALTVNDGTNDLTLDSTFAPGTYVYAAEVGDAVDEVTLSATLTDDGAEVSEVTLGGTAITDTDFTDGITVPSLVVGDNVIVVTVTAEDTSTTQTYTFTITRAAAPLTETEVPFTWDLKPTGLGSGNKFRLIFLSSTKRNATSTDIAAYNTFVQTRAAAGHTDIQAYSGGFTAVGCTATVDARDNTETTFTSTDKGIPIYWLNGTKAAADYEDFYDESWDDEVNLKNESGTAGRNTSQEATIPSPAAHTTAPRALPTWAFRARSAARTAKLASPGPTPPKPRPVPSAATTSRSPPPAAPCTDCRRSSRWESATRRASRCRRRRSR